MSQVSFMARFPDLKGLYLGSVIVLMRGYMGTILHTGDFRFHTSMIENYPELYPVSKRNPQLYDCSIHLDEIILDNTFCDPIFTFPSRVIQTTELSINSEKLGKGGSRRYQYY